MPQLLLFAPKFAIRFGAIAIQRERMTMQAKAARCGHLALTVFDFGVDKLFDSAARQAHQMIVMRAFVQLEHRAAAFEMIARQKPGLFKLGQHPIHRRKPDVDMLGYQRFVNVLGAHVTHAELLRTALKNFEHF